MVNNNEASGDPIDTKIAEIKAETVQLKAKAARLNAEANDLNAENAERETHITIHQNAIEVTNTNTDLLNATIPLVENVADLVGGNSDRVPYAVTAQIGEVTEGLLVKGEVHTIEQLKSLWQRRFGLIARLVNPLLENDSPLSAADRAKLNRSYNDFKLVLEKKLEIRVGGELGL
ncbi:MAG: hypothetical protein ACN2B6_06545 [Rickettsiales bacterium]